MKKPHGIKGSGGMKPAAPPMSGKPSAAPAPAGGGAGPMTITAPKSLKAFGHKTQDLKSLATDRGSFKIKG